MRKPILAGNWKMNKTATEASQFMTDLTAGLTDTKGVEAVLMPPDLFLHSMIKQATGTPFQLGAQTCHHKEAGAYTGETSPKALQDMGATYVILGHSERRTYFLETDVQINQKVKAALAHTLSPIVCVGETLAEREGGQTEDVIHTQLVGAFSGLDEADVSRCVVAYEPIWAIGSGQTASATQANDVAVFIRKTLASLYSKDAADAVRIQYGGSVKPENIGEFLAESDIDGALVGGASLEAASFIRLIEAVAHA